MSLFELVVISISLAMDAFTVSMMYGISMPKGNMPTHIGVRANRCGLGKDSILLTEQIRTLDKRRLRERAGRIPEDDMRRVDEALGVSMGLHDQPVAQSTHMDGGYF